MKTFDYAIDGIFPVPIYYSFDVKKFTKAELTAVNNHKKNCYGNVGNITSNNTYVLNTKSFQQLKSTLTRHINEYFQKVYMPKKKDLKLYITQSWLNYTKNNEFHHLHSHQNSFVSGVLYIKANPEFDSIILEKRQPLENILMNPHTYGLFNSAQWNYKIKTGMLILFPSTTPHSVKTKKDNNERISLAFNTYIKGTLGDTKSLTELIL